MCCEFADLEKHRAQLYRLRQEGMYDLHQRLTRIRERAKQEERDAIDEHYRKLAPIDKELEAIGRVLVTVRPADITRISQTSELPSKVRG